MFHGSNPIISWNKIYICIFYKNTDTLETKSYYSYKILKLCC